MNRLVHQMALHAVQAWGRLGMKSGWRYQLIERVGSGWGDGSLRPSRLPNGCEVLCDLRDEVQRIIYFWGCYEAIEARLFMRLLRPGMVVVDAGANVGQYTILSATEVGPGGSVHSFEPVPATFARLEDNLRRNQLSNVRLNNSALWSESKRLSFGLAADMRDNAGAYGVSAERDASSIECSAITLDEYVAFSGLEHVDVIKMDIEGAELPALLGARRTLAQSHPLLLVEINRRAASRAGYDVEDIRKLLVEELGYHANYLRFEARDCVPVNDFAADEQVNVLFWHGATPPEALTAGWDSRDVFRWARSGSVGTDG